MSEPSPRTPSSLPPLGTLFQESWQRFLRHGSRLIAIAVIGGVLSLLIEYLFDRSATLTMLRDGMFLTLDTRTGPGLRAEIATTVATFVIDAITLRAMFLLLRTPSLSTRALLRSTADRFLPFFIVNVLVTVLVALGLLAFIVPGVVLLLTLILAPVVVVWEDRGMLHACRRSIALTRGVRLRILAVLLVASLITGSLGLLLGAIPYLASFTQIAFVVPFLTVVTVTLYTSLVRTQTA